MQSLSSPDMTRPREEDSFSLEHVNRGGELVATSSESLVVAIEAGTPRGNETTMGSCSGLMGVTSTPTAVVADIMRLFGGADAGCLAVVRDGALRFLGLTLVDDMVSRLRGTRTRSKVLGNGNVHCRCWYFALCMMMMVTVIEVDGGGGGSGCFGGKQRETLSFARHILAGSPVHRPVQLPNTVSAQ